MSVSMRTNQDSQILTGTNPDLDSITLQGDTLQRIEKRTPFQNFVSWFIYIITFTLVPRNADLDRVSLRILGEIGDELNNSLTTDERKLLKKAVKTLIKIINNNCGSQSQKAIELHTTIKTIRTVPAVQLLVPEGPCPMDVGDQQLAPATVSEKEANVPDEDDLDEDIQDSNIPLAKDESEGQTREELSVAPEQNVSVAEELPISLSEETFLKGLQDLIDRNTPISFRDGERSTIFNAVLNPFFEMQRPVQLSEEQTKIFGEILHEWESSCKIESFLQLTPEMISFLTRISLSNDKLGCIEQLVEALKQEPVNPDKLQAFLQAFSTLPEELSVKNISTLLFRLSYSYQGPTFIFILRSHLPEGAILKFVHTLLEKGVSQITEKNDDSDGFFTSAVILDNAEQLGVEYRRRIHLILSLLTPVEFLVRLIRHTTKEDCVIEVILNNHPPRDEEDLFFSQLLDRLMSTGNRPDNGNGEEDRLNPENRRLVNDISAFMHKSEIEKRLDKVAHYILNHASEKRKQLFLRKLSTENIVRYIKEIPTPLLSQLGDEKLIDVAKEICDKHDNDDDLQILAQAFNTNILNILFDLNCTNYRMARFIPLLKREDQVYLVNKFLSFDDSLSFRITDALKTLSPDIWEEASRQNPGREYSYKFDNLPPEICARVVNGQIGNRQFCKDFFKSYFESGITKKENRIQIAPHLNPEIFAFDNPAEGSGMSWRNFFITLRDLTDQDHAKALLKKSTALLFNDPSYSFVLRDCIYDLTMEQMQSLNLDDYQRSDIRLLLACLTRRLDAGMLATANALCDMDGGDFSNILEIFLKDEGIENLKYFVRWLVSFDRKSSMIQAWTWVDEDYHHFLLYPAIKNNAEIQQRIRALGLTVSQPKRGW